MDIFIATLIIILAMIIGSFFTALVYRLYKSESMMHGRSKCPECQHVLTIADLIPVFSYLFLRGKCRYCHQPISIYYPLVELGTVAYWLVGYLYYGLTVNYVIYLVIASFLFLILVFDWRYGLIPDAISLPAIIVAILVSLYQSLDWRYLVLGGVFGFLFFAVQYFFSRGRWVGDGDLRLGALMGVILGFKYLWLALILAYIIGAIIALILIASKKKDLQGQIAFGPFLVIATWIAMLWGQQILAWYWNLLN